MPCLKHNQLGTAKSGPRETRGLIPKLKWYSNRLLTYGYQVRILGESLSLCVV